MPNPTLPVWTKVYGPDLDFPDFPSVAFENGNTWILMVGTGKDQNPPKIFTIWKKNNSTNPNPWDTWEIAPILNPTDSPIPGTHPPIIATNDTTAWATTPKAYVEIFGHFDRMRHVWQKYQNKTSQNFDFPVATLKKLDATGWPGGKTGSRLKAAYNFDGHLQLFVSVLPNEDPAEYWTNAARPRDLYTVARTKVGPPWSNWKKLGHPPSGDFGGFAVFPSDLPDPVSYWPKTIDSSTLSVFAIGRDGELWFLQQRLAMGSSGSWDNINWQSLGNYGISLTGTPAIAQAQVQTEINVNGENQLQTDHLRFVFTTGLDGLAYLIAEQRSKPEVNLRIMSPTSPDNTNNLTFPDSGMLGWTDWCPLPAIPGAENKFCSIFGADISNNGHICVFAQTQSDIWVFSIDPANLSNTPLYNPNITAWPPASANSTGLWQKIQHRDSKEKSYFVNIRNPVLAKNKAGYLQIFIVTDDAGGSSVWNLDEQAQNSILW